MVSKKIIIKNELGLHLRPASILCEESLKFQSRVSVKKNDTTVNAKSVLGVLAACVKSGEEIELICEGEDEEAALSVLSKLMEEGLGDQIE